MAKVKITVAKRISNQDLIAEYGKGMEPLCEAVKEGEEFISEDFAMPAGFCPWAWADIRHDILTLMSGGNFYWVKQKGTAISGCTDWFRPVIFKIERIES